MQKAANVYMQTKVNTTDQGHLLIMLYDGALTFLAQARDKMIARDFAAKGQLISKAIDIVNELASSLNLEKGGSLAENLNNLYFLCTARLLQANLKMNVDQLDSVVRILSGLRGAYAQIVDSPEARQAVQQIGARIQPEMTNNQRVLSTPSAATSAPMGQMQGRAAYQMAAARMQAQATASAPAPTVDSAVTPAAQAEATMQAATAAPIAPVDAPVQQTAPALSATVAPATAQVTPVAPFAAAMAKSGAPAAPAAAAQAQPVASATNQAAVKIPYTAPGAQPSAATVAPTAPTETVAAPATPPPAATRLAFNKKLAAYGKLAS